MYDKYLINLRRFCNVLSVDEMDERWTFPFVIANSQFINPPTKKNQSYIHSMKSTSLTSMAFVLATGAFLTGASAQSTWTGGTGNYDTPGNWNPSGVPALTDEVIINTGTATRTGSDNNNLTRRATTTIDGGSLVLDNVRFLNAEGGATTFNMDSGSLTQNASTYFIVGRSAAGTFNQSGGLVDVTVGRGFSTTDGHGSAQGTYNLTGGTLDIKMNKFGADADTNELFNFWIGRTGNANAALFDTFYVNGGTMLLDVTGPAAATRNMLIARNSVFQVDSGSVSMDNLRSVVVGARRGTGAGGAVFGDKNPQFLVNGGTTEINVSTGFVVGSATNGTLTVTDGSLTIGQVGGVGGELRLGETGATTSIVTADLDSTTTSTVNLTGGILDVEGDIVLSINAFNTSTFNMSGGLLFANDIYAGAGTAAFNFTGGTIRLIGDRTDILSESWFAATPGSFATFDAVNDWTIVAIPEPSSAALFVLSALGFLALRRHLKKS